MNRNNRVIRTLIAAKRAFLTNTMPPAPKQQDNRKRTSATAAYKAHTESAAQESTAIVLKDKPETINDLRHSYCTGCTACYNICPVNAISLGRDGQGYVTPVIDSGKCIRCKKCANACPVMNTKYTNSSDPKCYAAMADDEIRMNSSSGGMFTLIAEHMIDNGGYVAGAAFDDDFTVRHIIVDNKKDLEKLRGSKYVQSYLGDIFRQVKDLLDNDKPVLFTGCPCQVAGLYGMLGKKRYDKLITVDLVCHGAPSQKSFNRYIEEKYGTENLVSFKFRTKKFGYNSFNQIAYLKDGTEVAGNIKFDEYEKAMHSGVALKSVCGDCMFASAPRQGDISIGDCWGVSQFNVNYNDHKGTSALLINNAKGQKLFELIKGRMKLCEPVPYDFLRQHNRFGRKMNIPAGRRWFYTMLEGQSFGKSVNYALNRKFDVGVIGLWYGRNYGSMATYFALHQTLTNTFHLSVLMINNPLAPAAENYEKTHPRLVAKKFYDVSLVYPLNELYKLNSHCDTFIVGSDQLWNIYLSRPYRQMYYLDFAEERKKKIAYGTSFGIPYCGTEEEKLISSDNLRKFDHVSVRDDMSLDIATNIFGVENVEKVCDPTFLCPVEEYQKLIDMAQQKEDKDYILAYILDPDEDIVKNIKLISEKLNKKIVVILDELPDKYKSNVEKFDLSDGADIEIKSEVTLYDWMWYYSHARSVVTDSFHGTIFSIIFGKPFLTLTNRRRGAERFVSLLTPLDLTYRLFDAPDMLSDNYSLLESIDCAQYEEKLEEMRSNSLEWLKNAIYSKKTGENNMVFDYESRSRNRLNERN